MSRKKGLTGKVTHSVPTVIDGKIVTSTISIATSEVLRDGESVNPGLPGAFDMQVLFCLMDMWDEKGRDPNGMVKFNFAQLTKRLNLRLSGRAYADLKFSVKKLAVTKIESVKSFFSVESAGYVNSIVNILENPEFIEAKAGRAGVDTCTVYLSKSILKNLLNNYTGQISRKTYQSLDISFSQRILTLFLYRQQMKREIDTVDFEIFELAKIIPISGKLFPSKIKERLATGLKELEDKKVLKHEFIDVGKKVVLRLTPFHKVDHFLNSPDRLPIFVKMCESVYGVSPLTFFEMSETMALKSAEKYDTIHKHENREYLWFFHCLDVVLTQATSGYQIKNKQAFLKNFLDAKEIDYPFNFIPVDIRYTDQKNKAELTKSLVVRENIEQDTEEELFRIANTYATILVQSGREEYLARVKALKPTELFSNRTIENFEIAELIAEDIKSGKDILHHLDDKKLAIAKSKNPLLEKQT